MMKINFPILDESLELEGSTSLILEDVTIFSDVVKMFYHYDEDSTLKLFDKKQSALKPAEMILITDIFGFEINSASVLKGIYTDLGDQLNNKPEVKTAIEAEVIKIADLLSHELIDHELDLEIGEVALNDLYKLFGIRVETKSDTIPEKIIEILQIFKYLSKKKLLVFINAQSYLTDREFQSIHEFISLEGLTVLFVEPRKTISCLGYRLDSDYYLHLEKMI